jgi:hypothetical protein
MFWKIAKRTKTHPTCTNDPCVGFFGNILFLLKIWQLAICPYYVDMSWIIIFPKWQIFGHTDAKH